MKVRLNEDELYEILECLPKGALQERFMSMIDDFTGETCYGKELKKTHFKLSRMFTTFISTPKNTSNLRRAKERIAKYRAKKTVYYNDRRLEEIATSVKLAGAPEPRFYFCDGISHVNIIPVANLYHKGLAPYNVDSFQLESAMLSWALSHPGTKEIARKYLFLRAKEAKDIQHFIYWS